MKTQNEKFQLQQVWNDTIEKGERELQPRDRVYASEIGGAMIDRYLKMRAEPYTNPPNSRSMRKFMAGDIWEWIVQTVLVRAGLSFTTQDKVLVENEGLLPISGRIDFIVGGTAKEEIDLSRLPEFMVKTAQAVAEQVKGKTYNQQIIEIKSVGSFVFESILNQDNPKTHHMLQACVYKKATDLPADVIYVCRDDVRLLQYSIDGIYDDLWQMVLEDLQRITHYHTNNIEPAKECLIIYDETAEKFTKNWKVEYSPYLTKLYSRDVDGIETPFQQPDEYYDWVAPVVARFNRTISKIKSHKELTGYDDKKVRAGTKSDKDNIEEMEKYGFTLQDLKITYD